ncbi:hypothetical protein PIIN_07841 [Serendipita indica DSM 11827]|uniref:Uncharacterized protein n=1 Tax=Serendipita indica (strain DSM 11827) TaxID=1109443 RepID=G4TRE5_SERID|nr:hypothetical protein PIIN_07841 [Serendipita indica DSM 11827]
MRPVLRPTPTEPRVWEALDLPKMHRRQDQPSASDTDPDCLAVSPDTQSCYPTSSTIAYQNQYTRFIWNTRYALFVGDNGDADVTLILRNAESDRQVGNWTMPNKLGRFSLAVDDTWWDQRAVTQWEGRPRNWTFYWQIIPATHTIDGGEARQPTFTVIQTALPNAYLSSTSASIISQSLASVSRSIAASESSSAQAAQQSRDAALQQSHNNSYFPPWAIALIVILGLISIVSILTLFFVVIRSARRKRSLQNRSSMGSDSPMIQGAGGPVSPIAASGMGGGPASLLAPPVRNAPSIRYNDGNSVASRTSAAEGVITGSDAAIMADAFRKALRKPDFADRPQEEGESPEQINAEESEALLLNRELAEDGKNIRSVSSQRGVKVVGDDESTRKESQGYSV